MHHVALLFSFNSGSHICLARLWVLGKHHQGWRWLCEHLWPAAQGIWQPQASFCRPFPQVMWCQKKGKSKSLGHFIGCFGLLCQWLFTFDIPD